MVGLSTRYINLLVDGIPRRDPTIISWIKYYLESSFHDGYKYLHYKGDITHYYSGISQHPLPSRYKTNRLFCFFGNTLIASIGLHKFKRFCRKYEKDILKSGIY